MSATVDVCFHAGVVGNHGHEQDVEQAPESPWSHLRSVRSPTFYCAPCRLAATQRARWGKINVTGSRERG